MLRRQWQVVALTAWWLVLAPLGIAQEAYYLALQGEGTASVLIPKQGKTAYIIDGGKAENGITQAKMKHGKEVLRYLLNRGTKNLVIVCSHPHRDHMGGLAALIKDPIIREFDSYVFIDSGFEEHQNVKPLYNIFADFNPEQRAKAKRIKAEAGGTIHDVFQGKLAGDGSLQVSLFQYEPKPNGAHPHDHALIVEHTLRRGEKVVRVVNFDDAEDDLVKEWVQERGNDPAWTGRDKLLVGIMPHHGSNNTDVAPLLRDGLNWHAFVFTVNQRNQYGHPGARNLKLCMGRVKPDRVFFTGLQNVYITPDGIAALEPDKVRANYTAFVEPRLREMHKEITRDRAAIIEADAAGQDVSKQSKTAAKHYESYTDLLAVRTQMSARDALLPDPWDPKHPPRSHNDVARWRPDDLKYQPIEPSPGGESVGLFPVLMDKLNQVLPLGAQADRTRTRSRFFQALQIRPVFGGIILGNTAVSDLKVLKADIKVRRDGQPVIILEVSTSDGRRDTCRFEEMTMTELWSAYHFVAPTPAMQTQYGVRPGEASLLGMTRREVAVIGPGVGRQGDSSLPAMTVRPVRWHFAIHPAIADTILARERMRLDMLIAAKLQGLPQPPRFNSYQWYDQEAIISANEGVLQVKGKANPEDILLRVRFWGSKFPQPAWLLDHSLAQEVQNRLEERRQTLSAEIRRELQEEVHKSGPAWVNTGESQDVALRRESDQRHAAEVTKAKLNDSIPYRLEQLRKEAEQKVNEIPWGVEGASPMLGGRPATREEAFAQYYDEAVRGAGLDTSAQYLLERLQREARQQVENELKRERERLPQQFNLLLAYDRLREREAAKDSETARVYSAKVKAAYLENSPPYLLAQLRSKIWQDVRKNWTTPASLGNWEEQAAAKEREFADRYDEAARRAGLAESPEYRLERFRRDIERSLWEEIRTKRPAWVGKNESLYKAEQREFDRRYADRVKQLARDVEREVRSEVEGEVPNPHANYEKTVWTLSEAMRRIDRFARTVAVLNWLADQGRLPPLPPEVKPVLMKVPATLRFDDVLPKQTP
jgi:hypothetical protein